MQDAELVGGVLFYSDDPVAAGKVLCEILRSPSLDTRRVRTAGFEPVLVDSLRRKLPRDSREIEIACASGAAWVLGRRSATTEESWEAVASLPGKSPLPDGLRRTTGETMIGLASGARRRIRLAAPYVDESGVGFLCDSISAATRRGVMVELFDPVYWEPARAAARILLEAVAAFGDPRKMRLVYSTEDAPFSHLKVMLVDGRAAYVGSANLTAAGLAGRNLELGVLVYGRQVSVVERILDLYQDPNR